VLMSAGVVGIIFAVVMEIILQEPVYLLVMKISAGLFGVGGPMFGFMKARKARKTKKAGKNNDG